MISFRLPWYSLLLGAIVLAVASLLPLKETLKLPLFLVSVMLFLDGSLGLRTLPRLTPHASFPEDWRKIEEKLYFGSMGLARASASACACAALAAFSILFGDGHWRGWAAITIIIGFLIYWLFAAFKAIRDTLGNDS